MPSGEPLMNLATLPLLEIVFPFYRIRGIWIECKSKCLDLSLPVDLALTSHVCKRRVATQYSDPPPFPSCCAEPSS
uniref:Uncharacterized protein n=1 Tax=Arundo donax TaxID=35708 RepID=A0A0A9DTB1_ARUDO